MKLILFLIAKFSHQWSQIHIHHANTKVKPSVSSMWRSIMWHYWYYLSPVHKPFCSLSQYILQILFATRVLYICMKLLKHHGIFEPYCIFSVQLKSVAYQSIDSFYYAFFMLVVTQFVWILERVFTPQFRSQQFLASISFLLWLSLFKISRDICILCCNIKAVGGTRACISNTSWFTGLELKLICLASNWQNIFIWLKFLQRSFIKPSYVVPLFAVTWFVLFYWVPCFPGELGYPISTSV